MPKAIGNQTINLKSHDKVGMRMREKFANKALAPGKPKEVPNEPTKPKYKTRKK
jgi:hypothetical protein